MWKQAPSLRVTGSQQRTLKRWIQARSTPRGIVQRAEIVLLAAKGISNNQIAADLGVSRPTVILWRQRFAQGGPEALSEIKRPTRRPDKALSPKTVDAIVAATLHQKPQGQTHWSCRSMARTFEVSSASVQRIWDAHGLKPHLTKTFKLSTDRQFKEKLTDVVGLYLNPPDKAIILCVDEKSQIQALDRTQPGLPLKRGRCGTMTHDYKRHGTTSLFAALDVAEGTVIGQCYGRHRHQEFLKFLRHIDAAYPNDVDLHLILDNYGTHKHPAVKEWLTNHKRFRLHFTPTSSSWLNLVERWFRELTDKSVRRGVFRSVPELIRAIHEFLKAYNHNPKPLVWTASADSIIKKVNRCKVVMETLH